MIRTLRRTFATFKQTNTDLGMLGQEPDLKGKELDKFRRFFTKAHLGHAGKEMPNFETHPDDLPTLERNEVPASVVRLKPASCDSSETSRSCR